MFSFTLYTNYIFSYVDFVNTDIHNIYGKTPNELVDIFNGMKRSSSRSSNKENYCTYSIYTYIRKLWDSLDSYFSLKNLADEGFDIRKLDSLSRGMKEFINIIQNIESVFGSSFIEIHCIDKIRNYTNLNEPSISSYECEMFIKFVPMSEPSALPVLTQSSESHSPRSQSSLYSPSTSPQPSPTKSMVYIVYLNIALLNFSTERGRPRIYKDQSDRQRAFRIRRKKEKLDDSYKYLENQILKQKVKELNNYYFSLPRSFVNQTMFDTEMVEYVFRDGRMHVVALQDIKKGTRITKFSGWMKRSKSINFSLHVPVIYVNRKEYHGISHPRFMEGIASLIREASKKEVPNTKITLIKNILWAIAAINISKGDELLRPQFKK